MKVTFRGEAGDASVWDEPGFADAYWAAVADDVLHREGCADASDVDPWLLPDDAVASDDSSVSARLNALPASAIGIDAPGALSAVDPFALVERAGGAARTARAASAEQDRLFHEILTAADADPVPWVGADPTIDPLWRDPRGWTVAAVREHRRSLAVRSAAADIGARVQLTDNQVCNRAHRARILSERTPQLWAACRAGDVSDQNMMIAADLASSLPVDEPQVWAAFDTAIVEPATRAVPGRFRLQARAARERVHSESLADRHVRAATDRRVDITPELDGMAFLGALVPAEKAHAIDGDLEQRARHLLSLPDETRTLAQIRADVFTDLLLTEPVDEALAQAREDEDAGTTMGGAREKKPRTRAVVRITIPALTLLGRGEEPATLDGYGPIPLDTAKELAAGASSWIRVLTHPVTGTVIDVDRRMYKVPADIRRLLHTLHPTCVFPGCSRPADDCDYDHRRRWAGGGRTSLSNGQPLDARHHPLKDETLWRSDLDADTGRVTWTSPSGSTIDEDPPPF